MSLDHPQHPLRQLFAKDVAALEELLDVVSLGQVCFPGRCHLLQQQYVYPLKQAG